MKEKIKELQRQLEALATEFYEQSGAKTLYIEIRITPWETTNKIGLEYNDGHAHDAHEPGCGPACKGD